MAAIATSLLFAAAALAEDEGVHGHGGGETAGVLPTTAQAIVPMLVSIGVFLVVFVILAVKVWPPIVKGLKDRENKIRSEIESAEQAQKQAREALAQYERNLAQARAEAQRMLDDAKTQQAAIAAELRAKSETELNAMREKAKRDIDQAKRAAVAEIHQHATDLAMNIAAKILQREIGPQDQRRLVTESLEELQSAGRA